jgi:hypothetical protein
MSPIAIIAEHLAAAGLITKCRHVAVLFGL